MHHVNCTYCQWFNRRHGRVGHVLQGRFGARIVDDGNYLLNPTEGCARYVDHVATPAAADESVDPFLAGGEELRRRVHPLLKPHRYSREFVHAERFVTRPALDDILMNADSTSALKQAACEAFHRHAYTLREIGDMTGRSPATISKWIASRGVRS